MNDTKGSIAMFPRTHNRKGFWRSVLTVQFLVLLTLQSAEAQSTAEESYQRAVLAMQHEQWKNAVGLFEETLKVNPHRAAAENGLGAAYGKLGDREASVAAFQRAITDDPNYAEPHYNLGLWQQQSGNIAEAISELSKAIQLSPGYEE